MRQYASRRNFLRGLGAVVALPWLETLAPRVSFAQSVTPPKRFLMFYTPCGMNMVDWTPSQTGSSFPLSTILAPLAPVQKQILVLSNLENSVAEKSTNDGLGGDHNRGTASFASCVHINNTTQLSASMTADQMLAPMLSAANPIQSLQLGVVMSNEQGTANCDLNYSCPYTLAISWANATTQLVPQVSPTSVFNQLFGGSNAPASVAQFNWRARLRKSVLDDILSQSQSLVGRVSAADKPRLDQYYTSVRALETQLQASSRAACSAAVSGAPSVTTDLRTLYQQMNSLMVLAFQCDMTRVISYMFAPGQSVHLYDFLPGINDTHHSLSHHQQSNWSQQLTTINTYEVQVFADLVQQLAAIDDGNGSILDNSVLMLSSELSDGNDHTHGPMPVLLAGGRNAGIRGNQHIAYPANTDYASLWLSLLQTFGLPVSTFGTSQESTPLPSWT